MNLLKIVNEIIGLAKIGDYSKINAISIRGFGHGEKSVNFINENKSKYFEALTKAFSLDPDIESSYTLKKYETLLIRHFKEFMLQGLSVQQSDIDLFCKQLKSEQKVEFSVFREIYGIIVKNSSNPVKIGNYTIYSIEAHKQIIELKVKLDPEYVLSRHTPKYLIEWKAEARDIEKAIEIADRQFEKFELILRYVIGNPTSHFEVGVLNYQGWRHRRAYVFFNDDQFSTSASNHGPAEAIQIDDPYFVSEEAGYKYIWELVGKQNLNEFQKRILLAVEWIGQSMADPSPQSAFLKSAIALEIIFTYNEKAIITPSILSQISEGVALILGKSIEQRLEIESTVKKLYGLRSAIVHSGNKNISESDYQVMLATSRDVLVKLVTSSELIAIESVEKLYTLLKKTKYSGNAI